MSFLSRLLLGQEYEDGYNCAEVWRKQGGSNPTPGDTIDSIYQSAEGSSTPEKFYEGWRDSEEDSHTFWQWLRGK